jgi:hypothetical protein
MLLCDETAFASDPLRSKVIEETTERLLFENKNKIARLNDSSGVGGLIDTSNVKRFRQ